MTRYEIENSIEKIDGYFSPSPYKSGGDEEEFERAKQLCIKAYKKQVKRLESITFEQFAREKRLRKRLSSEK